MKGTLRFTWRTTMHMLLLLVCVAGVLVALDWTAAQAQLPLLHILDIYLSLFPTITMLVLFAACSPFLSYGLNVALSMGARRRDYLLSLQLCFLVLIGGCCGILALVSGAVGWLGLEVSIFFPPVPLCLIPLFLLLIVQAGCAISMISLSHRVAGSILSVAAVLLMIAPSIWYALLDIKALNMPALPPTWLLFPVILGLTVLLIWALGRQIMRVTVR